MFVMIPELMASSEIVGETSEVLGGAEESLRRTELKTEPEKEIFSLEDEILENSDPSDEDEYLPPGSSRRSESRDRSRSSGMLSEGHPLSSSLQNHRGLTLSCISDSSGSRSAFAAEVKKLWNALSAGYTKNWWSAHSMGANHPVKLVLCVKEGAEEEKRIEPLRIRTYLFLRALMNNAVSRHEQPKKLRSIAKLSRRIQVYFVKMLCLVAWNIRNDLSRKIHWKSLVCVSYIKEQRKYTSACILCPKMDRRRLVSTIEEASLNAIAHFNNKHFMGEASLYETLGRRTNLDGACELPLADYLAQIQRTISDHSRLVSLLDLKRPDQLPDGE